MDEFQQYKRKNNINPEEFKKSLKKVISEEMTRANGTAPTENEKIKMDQIAKKLIKVFDTNKNVKLEYQEAVSAFCVLCKGSVLSKLKYQMLAYTEMSDACDHDHPDPAEICVKFKNLKKYI